jgi:hypothetical protein
MISRSLYPCFGSLCVQDAPMTNEVEYMRQWRANNPEKCADYTKRYRSKDPNRWKEYKASWQKANRDRATEAARRWRLNNPEKAKAATARYRAAHPDRAAAATDKWRRDNLDHVNGHERNRCATDMSYRLARRLRMRVWDAIRNQSAKKRAGSMELIGCSVQFLLGYLEKSFTGKMAWSNYGSVWEIDHIRPCASFDLTKEKNQRECFHYSNLQPLLVSDNRRKYATHPSYKRKAKS